MNERALKIYHSTFSVELTKENSIEKTYGFVINEGTDTEPKLMHYIKGNITTNDMSRIRMIFNYENSGHFMERSVSGRFHIDKTFIYDEESDMSIGELPINIAGERIQTWF